MNGSLGQCDYHQNDSLKKIKFFNYTGIISVWNENGLNEYAAAGCYLMSICSIQLVPMVQAVE